MNKHSLRLLRIPATTLARLAVMIAAAILIGGCATNNTWREQALDLRTELRMTQDQRDRLQSQLITMRGENARIRSDLVAAHQKLAEMNAQPTPPPAPPNFGSGLEVTETPQAITVTLPDAVLFDSGKAVLKDSSRRTLDAVAAKIKRDYAGKTIRVEGHTDSDPIKRSNWADNWQLSTERALAVVRYLTTQGRLDPENVYAAGFSQFAPKAANSSAAGKARNRRVEIVIVK